MTLLTMATTGAPLAASVVPLLVVSVVDSFDDGIGDTVGDLLVVGDLVDAVVDESLVGVVDVIGDTVGDLLVVGDLVDAVVDESLVGVVVTLFVNLVVDTLGEKLGDELRNARGGLVVSMYPSTNTVLDWEKVSQSLVLSLVSLQQL